MPIKIESKSYVRPKTQKTYLVSILNTNYVSWEFCRKALTDIFYMSQEDADAISNEIVTNGEGICGVYVFEIAETKAAMVEELAKKEGFSLYCLIEEV